MGLANKKILIVDDDETTRLFLSRVLTASECKTDCAPNIKSAFDILKRGFAPNLILLDLSMPDLDGFTFLKMRRQNEKLLNIPVMVISSTSEISDVSMSLELGADQFLLKPFYTNVLLQKLKYIFLKTEGLVYHFPENKMPSIEAKIQGTIVSQSPGILKIESQVKFMVGKSVEVFSEDFIKNKGHPLICRVDNRIVNVKDGFFQTVLSPVGFDAKMKKDFELWQRSLVL